MTCGNKHLQVKMYILKGKLSQQATSSFHDTILLFYVFVLFGFCFFFFLFKWFDLGGARAEGGCMREQGDKWDWMPDVKPTKNKREILLKGCFLAIYHIITFYFEPHYVSQLKFAVRLPHKEPSFSLASWHFPCGVMSAGVMLVSLPHSWLVHDTLPHSGWSCSGSFFFISISSLGQVAIVGQYVCLVDPSSRLESRLLQTRKISSNSIWLLICSQLPT